MSSRQIEVNRNKILDWLKADGLVFDEVDVSKSPILEWNIHIKANNLSIYTMTAVPDRVVIQSDISFTQEQKDLLHKKWSKIKLNTLILNITTSLTNFNVRYTILHDKDVMTGIRINLFLIDSLNKDTLMNSVVRIGEVLRVTLYQLSSVIGVGLEELKQQQEASSFNPLAT